MRKIITALMCLGPVTILRANTDLNHKWFISTGTPVYSRTDVRADVVGRRSSETYRDKVSGYFMGLGRDWEWIAAGLYFSGFSIDYVRVQTLTGRITMPVFPIDNLPYLVIEYGVAQVNNKKLHLHTRGNMSGIGTGVRFDITDRFFFNIDCIYNRARFKVDVVDVPVKAHANRLNTMIGIGYCFFAVIHVYR